MDNFDEFYADAEPRLRRALVAALGSTRGRDATVEALSFAWERWDLVRTMAKPLAYLFRVGQTRTQTRPPRAVFPAPADAGMPWIEPALPQALLGLSTHQRVCVVLAHGYGWTHREIADLLELSASTVQNHVERAMAKLRNALEVNVHE
jgi:DNA-directed RNA polymerase specialized sigma24 family protein